MKKKTQIFYIHGGETFRNRKDYLHFLKTKSVSIKTKKRWADAYLDEKLGKNFEIIKPLMPQHYNAKYEDWKIYFERFFPFLRDNIILIGNSLGGMFLAKYLSEQKFPKKIKALYLVAPPFDNSLPKHDLVNRFKLKSNLSLIEKNISKITLLFSKDDDVIPLLHAKKYMSKLKNAKLIVYKSKNGHFQVSKFPEIIKLIKNVAK